MCCHSGLASAPPETLNHSTSTEPLNFFGLIGRFTTMRLLYSAGENCVTAHLPSFVSGFTGVCALAIPSTKNSDCEYPTVARSNAA